MRHQMATFNKNDSNHFAQLDGATKLSFDQDKEASVINGSKTLTLYAARTYSGSTKVNTNKVGTKWGQSVKRGWGAKILPLPFCALTRRGGGRGCH